jgi:hypothetical protein
LPFVYGSLSSEAIYLKEALPAAPTSPVAKGPDLDEVAWGLMRDTRDTAQIERFIAQFPQSPRRVEAEQRMAALQTERTAAEAAAKTRAEADAKVAALSGRAELSRSLQFELKRVGCLDAALSNDFGKPAQEALQKFAKFAAVNLSPGSEISGDTLSAIRRFDRRVCPLNCRGDEKIEGDRCVRVVCAAGQIAAKGSCIADHNKQAAPTASEKPASGGTKCFTFNNRRFCE